MEKVTILVAGSSGFIGSNISRYLSALGFQVYGLVRETSNLWRIRDLQEPFHLIKIKSYDLSSLNDVFAKIKPDIIINAVGADQKETEGRPEENWKSNFLPLVSMTNAMTNTTIKLIHLGSSFEYGRSSVTNSTVNENMICEPASEYATVKYLQTEYLKFMSSRNKLPITVLRVFNIYGPFESKTRLIPQIILKSIEKKKLTLFNPNVVRDFIYVDDLSDAIVRTINYNSKSNFEIFNIGTGIDTKVIDVVKHVSLISGEHIETDMNIGDFRPENSLYGPIADISKAKEKLKWAPRFSLSEGLRYNYEWFLSNFNLYSDTTS